MTAAPFPGERAPAAWPATLAALGASLLLALMLATANWLLAALIVGAAAGLVLVLLGLRTLFAVWLVGSPTFFVFLNDQIHAIPALTMERLLFGVLAALLLARAIVQKRRPEWDAPERWILAFLGIGAALLVPVSLHKPVGEFVSRDLGLYVQAYLMPMTAYLLARRLGWDDRALARLGLGLLVAGLVLAGSAFLQVFAGVTAFVPQYMEVIHSEDRATGVFNNATEFGMVMNALLLVGLLFLVRTRDPLARILLLACVAVMLGAVLLSSTRATWAGLLVSLVVVYAAEKRLRPALGLIAGLASVAGLLALPFLIDSGVIHRRVTDLEPIFNRIAGAATALNMLAHHPLFGIGFERGAFGQIVAEYLAGFGNVSARWAAVIAVPHNEHINVALLTGLAGFIPYVALFFVLFRMLRDTRRHTPAGSLARDMAGFTTAMLASYLANGFFVDFGSHIYIGVLMFAALGFTSDRLRAEVARDATSIVSGTRARRSRAGRKLPPLPPRG